MPLTLTLTHACHLTIGKKNPNDPTLSIFHPVLPLFHPILPLNKMPLYFSPRSVTMTPPSASNDTHRFLNSESCFVCCNELQSHPLEPTGSVVSLCTLYKQECGHNPTHLSRYLCLEHEAYFKNLTTAKKHVRNMKKRHEKKYEPAEPAEPVFPLESASTYIDPEPTTLGKLNEYLEDKVNDEGLRQYIRDEHSGHLSGCRLLVKRAFGSPDQQLPSVDETFFHLLMTSYLITLTESQRETFYTLVEIMYSNTVTLCELRHKADMEQNVATFPSNFIFQSGTTRLPTNRQDFQQFYLNKTTSIINRLPQPSVHNSNTDSHAYLDYFEVVQHYLALARTPAPRYWVRSIRNNAKKLRTSSFAW